MTITPHACHSRESGNLFPNMKGVNYLMLPVVIRKRIASFCEVDESYFDGKRIKGKRGRGAASKTPVFRILQRGGKVDSESVIHLWKTKYLQNTLENY